MMQPRILAAALPFLLVLLPGCSILFPDDEPLEVKAARIHDEILTVDTHVDTPMRLTRGDFNLAGRHDPRQRGGKVDFPRMKEGGLDAIFFAVFVGQGPRTPEGNENAKESALETFEAIHTAVKAHPEIAEVALTPKDAYRIEKAGKRAIFIGMENGYPIGDDLSLIRRYHELGARYITLCHTRNNDICDSSTDEPEHGGLSAFGKEVVLEMNRAGMLIDVSHSSDAAFHDVLEVTKAPVFASHSCARALCNHERNLDDGMLRALAGNGGVIQMCVLSAFVKEPEPNPERDAAIAAWREKRGNFRDLPEEEREKAREEWNAIDEKYPRKLANVSDVVDHIDHIVRVAGIDHVGIGTDFDGGGGVDGCYDVSEMGNITLELVRRGYTEDQIRKIWGGNFMRVFRQVEELNRE